MKVILRNHVDGLGKKGDVVDVADGFGRNFLVPSGNALLATKGAMDQAAAMRRARDLKDTRDREAAQTVAGILVATPIVISMRAGAGGKLFGSVGTADISEAISAQVWAEVDRRKINLDEPLRSLGTFDVPVKLHSDVQFTVSVEIKASES